MQNGPLQNIISDSCVKAVGCDLLVGLEHHLVGLENVISGFFVLFFWLNTMIVTLSASKIHTNKKFQ